MGWSINLKSNREISVDDVSKVVDVLPPNLKGAANHPEWKSRQPWGWSVGVDIWNPENKTLKLRGSYTMSGNIAIDSAKFISDELTKLGHKIKMGKIN